MSSAFKAGHFLIEDSLMPGNAFGPFYCKTPEDLLQCIDSQGFALDPNTSLVKAFRVDMVLEVGTSVSMKKGKLPLKKA
jgi:hypothetical protein